MKRVKAQFVASYRPHLLAGAVLTALLIACAVQAYMAHKAWRALEAARAETAYEAERREAAAAQAASATLPKVPPAHIAALREMLKERQAHWPSALTALENAAVVGVTPTSLSFAAKERRMTVEVSIASIKALYGYLEMLNIGAGPDDSAWHWRLDVAEMQEPNVGRATIIADWRERAQSEATEGSRR